MIKFYFRPLFFSFVVGLLFVSLFYFWKKRTSSVEGTEKIAVLTSMEDKGVPSFSAMDFNGKMFDINNYRDSAVIVNFWATWCGPCVEEVPSLISLVDAMNGKLKLVAVSGDESKEDIESFLKAFPRLNNPNITIIWDADKSIARKYSVDRLPESFVLGTNLKLAKKILGSIPWHTNESEQYIRQLYSK